MNRVYFFCCLAVFLLVLSICNEINKCQQLYGEILLKMHAFLFYVFRLDILLF